MTESEWPSRVWARIAVVTGISAVAMLLVERSPALVQALAPLDIIAARATAQILGWLGMDAQREVATLIHSSGFGYEIVFRCSGVIPAGLLVAAILSAGASLRARLWGAAVGALGMLLLNLVRLASLFYIGVQFPRAFGVAHALVWQVLTVLSLIGFFYAWRRYTFLPLPFARQRCRFETPSNRM
jgi:exosortase/archaeosortase family protein